MFEAKLDSQLVRVLMFCSCSCPLFEQGTGWLFQCLIISESDLDLTQDCRESCVIVHDMWCQWWSVCFSHFDSIWPVPTYLINLWTGLKRYCYPCHVCRTFRNEMWPVVQFYFSNISSPIQFQLHSRYQVLPPRRRWDLCLWQLRQLGRNHQNFRVIGQGVWRCRAQEFLLGLWHDLEMAVGSVRWTLESEIRKGIEEISIDFHNFPSMLETKLDCQLVQVLMFFSCSFPLFEYE